MYETTEGPNYFPLPSMPAFRHEYLMVCVRISSLQRTSSVCIEYTYLFLPCTSMLLGEGKHRTEHMHANWCLVIELEL